MSIQVEDEDKTLKDMGMCILCFLPTIERVQPAECPEEIELDADEDEEHIARAYQQQLPEDSHEVESSEYHYPEQEKENSAVCSFVSRSQKEQTQEFPPIKSSNRPAMSTIAEESNFSANSGAFNLFAIEDFGSFSCSNVSRENKSCLIKYAAG